MGAFTETLFSHHTRIEFRTSKNDFTRDRKLSFGQLSIFMFSLLTKTLQIEITDFLNKIRSGVTSYTSSAFTQSRKKIKPELFSYMMGELSKEFYSDNDERVKLWKGFRLLAVDGSTLELPNVASLSLVFGRYKNQYGLGKVLARCSVLYDLENEMVLDGVLSNPKTGERALAKSHIKVLKESNFKELILFDRGYSSFDLVYSLVESNIAFVMRVKELFNTEVKQFHDSKTTEDVIEISAGTGRSSTGKIQVRIIKILLDNGEVELLITSLINKRIYPTSVFKQLYFKRWGVETFYDKLKNKIKVEYFTGYSEMSVRQDFFCSLLMNNIQSLLVSEANEELQEKNSQTKYEYKVNTNLSLGFIKQKLVDVFLGEMPLETVLLELQTLFIRNIIPIRPNRTYPREKDKFGRLGLPAVTKNFKSTL